MAIYKRSRAVLEPGTAGWRVRRADYSATLSPVYDDDDDDDMMKTTTSNESCWTH